MHRDSIGSKQRILPGDVNWMTAGKGIAHSERIPLELRSSGHRLHGLQAWVALPRGAEEAEPSFAHYDRSALPTFMVNGSTINLVAGSALGRVSPVRTHSPLFYAMVTMPVRESLRLEAGGAESAFYLLRGKIRVDGQVFDKPALLVFKPASSVEILAESDSRGVWFGGVPLEGPRFIWWNFVSSSKERIEKAKQDWREQRFGRLPEETEFVPLPGEGQPTEKSTLP